MRRARRVKIPNGEAIVVIKLPAKKIKWIRTLIEEIVETMW